MRGLTFILLLILLGSAAAGEWSQWRGPRRDGHAGDIPLPQHWPKQLREVFRLEVGEGHAAPVLAENRLLLFTRVGEEEVVKALDAATGKEIWRHSYKAPYTMDPAATGHGKGPKATPTVHEGKVYVFGMSAVLSCLDAGSGKLVWRHDFLKELEAPGPQFGTAASPLIDGDKVIVPVGSTKDGWIMAFDRNTGTLVWRCPCDGPAYSSPIAWERQGTRQIVLLTRNLLIGVDASKGTLLWQVKFHTAYEQNCLTPVADRDQLIISGYGRPTVAYKLAGQGKSLRAQEAWSSDRLKMYMSSPVLVDGLLFGLDQTGKLVCLDARTGAQRWSGGEFGEYMSITRCGKHLLCLDERANLCVVAVSSEGYEESARLRVSEEPVWAHLGLAPGRLYVKDRTRLLAFELPR